jgi:hypothetical protein
MEEGTLTKLAGGLYAYPRQTVFGKAPAADDELVTRFLKDDRYLLASPNAYNSLGVGTTQLYDKTVVHNHKRHGEFALGGRKFDFRVKPTFPKKLSREFLLVDLVNNLDRLVESRKGPTTSRRIGKNMTNVTDELASAHSLTFHYANANPRQSQVITLLCPALNVSPR